MFLYFILFMKFKISNTDEEKNEIIDLDKRAKDVLTDFINKYSSLNLSIDPTKTTFTCRVVINADDERLGKTMRQLKLKQNSTIIIRNTADIRLA